MLGASGLLCSFKIITPHNSEIRHRQDLLRPWGPCNLGISHVLWLKSLEVAYKEQRVQRNWEQTMFTLILILNEQSESFLFDRQMSRTCYKNRSLIREIIIHLLFLTVCLTFLSLVKRRKPGQGKKNPNKTKLENLWHLFNKKPCNRSWQKDKIALKNFLRPVDFNLLSLRH